MNVEPARGRKQTRVRRSRSRSARPPSAKRRAEATPQGTQRPYVRPNIATALLMHGQLQRDYIRIPDGIELITFAHEGQDLQFHHAKTIFDELRAQAELMMHGTLNQLQEARIPSPIGDDGVVRLYKSGERCRNQRLKFKVDEPYLGFYAPDKAEFNYTIGRDMAARTSTASLDRLARQFEGLSVADRPRRILDFTHNVRNWPIRSADGQLTGTFLTTKGHESDATNRLIQALFHNDLGTYVTLDVLLQSLQRSLHASGMQKLRLFLIACQEITAADLEAIDYEIL